MVSILKKTRLNSLSISLSLKIYKIQSLIFKRMNKPKEQIDQGRRLLLKATGLSLIVSSLSPLVSCKPLYDGEGDYLARETDGQIMPSAASYFLSLQPVRSYSDELADVLNETWVKEFNSGIDRHIRIKFVDSLPDNAEGVYDDEVDFDWRRMRKRIKKQFSVLNTYEPNSCIIVISHELGHQFSDAEHLPELTQYRLCTGSSLHFPDFGAATNYFTFALSHSRMLELANKAFDNKESHNMGALVALLALNEQNGSFKEAHDALLTDGNNYLNQADIFIETCNQQPEVQDVHLVMPYAGGAEMITPTPYRSIAVYSLWNLIAHQLTSKIDNPLLKQGLKTAARYKTYIPHQPPAIIVYYDHNLYKEGFEQSDLQQKFPFIVVPDNYDYSIQKGL